MVHVGAEPMVVGDLVVGAGGDEEPLGPCTVGVEGTAWMVAVECEAALQPAANLGEARDSAAVCSEIVAVVQPVATGQPLQREIGERRARLTDGKAGVCAALEQHDVVALDLEDAREQRTGEATADDRYAHAGHEAGAGSREPVPRFMARMRAMRCGRHTSQAGSRSTSHRSAVTAADVI